MNPDFFPPPYERVGTTNRHIAPLSHHLRITSAQNGFSKAHATFASSALPTTDTTRLDFTQRLERKFAEYNASENVFRRWLFEIICWLVSAISMGAIIGIYVRLKDQPMIQAGDLLTYANTLGKIASAALIVPTSEALGQLKWNWFNQSRAMWDFEIFDKASRGPLGAILLLFRTKGRSLAALGAILIVLLLAIDTFFQQVVDIPERWALQSIPGTLPRIINYQPSFAYIYQYGYETSVEDRDLATNGREFFYGNGTQATPFGNGTRAEIPLTCPTSNCTWAPYETLAVCSSCADITPLVNTEYACLNMTINWSAAWEGPLKQVPYPNGTVCGYFLNVTSSNPTLLSGYVKPENGSVTAGEALIVRAIPLTDFDTRLPQYGHGSIMFKGIRLPIQDVLISSSKAGVNGVYRDEPPIVHECILTWCVHTMKSSYASGVYEEEILSTYIEPARSTDKWPWDHWEVESGTWFSYLQHLVLQPPQPRSSSFGAVVTNETYQIDNYTHSNVVNFFDDFFPSYYTALNISATPMLRYQNYPLVGPKLRQLKFNPWQYPNNITRHMERLAVAMTNTIRSSVSRDMLEGESYQVESYISVRWAWLTFPLSLLTLSLVFLIATIMKTSSDGAIGFWKTSAMPTLIYSLPKETQSQFASTSTWGSGSGAPRKTRIKLLPNMGWRVSGQSYLSRSPRLPSGERVPRGWI